MFEDGGDKKVSQLQTSYLSVSGSLVFSGPITYVSNNFIDA